MFKGKFEDIVLLHEGFLRGPFGSALKKSLFVPKAEDTYKVYEQSVVLQEDKTLGEYYISKKYFEENLSRFEVKSGDFLVSCSGVNYGAIYQLKGEIDKGVINQALLRIRINPEIVDENYFLYYFRAYIVKKIIGGTGDSTIPNFPPMSVIKSIDIELPKLKDNGLLLKNKKGINERFFNISYDMCNLSNFFTIYRTKLLPSEVTTWKMKKLLSFIGRETSLLFPQLRKNTENTFLRLLTISSMMLKTAVKA